MTGDAYSEKETKNVQLALMDWIDCHLYYSHLSLKVIHKAEVANNFFEQVYNTNCSDEKTNFILKYIAEEFFSYGNKFFNIKMLSIYEIGFCLMIIFYTFFAKRNLDKKRAKKEKQTNYFNFE